MFGCDEGVVELICLIAIGCCVQITFLISTDASGRTQLTGTGPTELRDGLNNLIKQSHQKTPEKIKKKKIKTLNSDNRKTRQQLEDELREADSYASRATDKLSKIKVKQLEEEMTFATNTVDKILYEIKNMDSTNDPPFASPQFNPPPQKYVSDNLNTLIGISTINRKKQNYLFGTVSNIMERISEEEKKSIKIIIMNGNVPASDHTDVKKVRETFASEIEEGFIVIKERSEPYPQLQDSSKLTLRWGDSKERVMWRSKQVLDVSSLMGFASDYPKYKYFLMLEDDVKVAESFPTAIRTWVDSHLTSRTDWLVASFYNPWKVTDMQLIPNYNFFGVIGQLFRIHDLPHVTNYLLKNYDESPLDWLFVDYLTKYNKTMIAHSPSLFQHLGVVSSLANKVQPSRAAEFDEFPLKK